MRLSNHLLLGVASLAVFATAQTGQDGNNDDVAPVTGGEDNIAPIVNGEDDTVTDDSDNNDTTVEGPNDTVIQDTFNGNISVIEQGVSVNLARSSSTTVVPSTTGTSTTNIRTGTAPPISPPANTHGTDTTSIGADEFTVDGPVRLENIQGRDVFVMMATPASDAKLLSNDIDLPPNARPGDRLTISATIIAQVNPDEVNDGGRARQEVGRPHIRTNCTLTFEINGKQAVLNQNLETTVQPLNVRSNPFRVDSPFDLKVTMTCDNGSLATLSIFDFVLAPIIPRPPTGTSTTHTAISTTHPRTSTTDTHPLPPHHGGNHPHHGGHGGKPDCKNGQCENNITIINTWGGKDCGDEKKPCGHCEGGDKGNVVVSSAGHVVAGISTLFLIGGVTFIIG